MSIGSTSIAYWGGGGAPFIAPPMLTRDVIATAAAAWVGRRCYVGRRFPMDGGKL